MAQIGVGTIPITFDKAQIGKSLSAGVAGGAKASEGSITSTFKKLAGLATAAFGAQKVFSFVGDSIDAAREANKVAAQTEAVIKSTGGAAHLTAGDFSELAGSISAKTGIDDEQIQSAENLLATFTNVREEVGAGNDIFTQATKTAVDMGAALGGDASSNAILLGKALNDPIRGLTALTRVGVSFTDEQRDQIKWMQESGDTLGAQKIILAELTTEFGGSAEATATAGAKFSVFFGNVQEAIGNFLIPMLDKLATWAMETLPGAFGAFQVAVAAVTPTLQTIGDTIATVLTPVIQFFIDHWDQLKVVLIAVGVVVAGALLTAFVTIVVPLGLVIAAGAALLAGALLLIQGFQWLWEKLEPVRNILGEVASVASGVLVGAFGEVWGAAETLAGWLQTLWEKTDSLRSLMADAFRLGLDVARGAIDALRGAFELVIKAAEWLIDKVQWLIDHIPSIPELPSWGEGGVNPTQQGTPGLPGGHEQRHFNMAGTNFWKGGLTHVNEAGGEIMNLPTGTQIIPHDVSMAMAGRGPSIHIDVHVAGYVSDKRAMAELGEAVAQPVRRVLLKTSGRNPAGVIGLL